MKRIMISAAMTLCAVLFQVSVQCADVSARPMNWYCVHVHDGTQPQCDPEMEFIGQYGGYYIDKNNSDPCAAEKVIYLTFDAGYENGNIEKILDVMKAEGVTGAFFIAPQGKNSCITAAKHYNKRKRSLHPEIQNKQGATYGTTDH